MELNPAHALLEKLAGLAGSDNESFDDHAFMLYSNALLAEGAELPDPARFHRVLASLMLK